MPPVVSFELQVPDTFFTAPPHFRWLIILYFFIGGISGGALLLASLVRIFGTVQDRPFVRLASYVSFAGAVVSGVLLTLDLGVPLRFWHMLFQNHSGGIMFKWWSPMSVGAWGLLFFGFVAFLASLGGLAEEGRLRWPPLRRLAEAPLGIIGAIGGIIGGLFLAGYTGVLLAVTNRPLWADSSWLGVLFLLSAVSTSVAALVLVARWRRIDVAATFAWLQRFDRTALLLELIAIVCFVISLGGAARALLNAWGVLLLFGVIGLGIVVPFRLERGGADRDFTRAATCVLIGGFLLRTVMLLSSEQVHVVGAQIFR